MARLTQYIIDLNTGRNVGIDVPAPGNRVRNYSIGCDLICSITNDDGTYDNITIPGSYTPMTGDSADYGGHFEMLNDDDDPSKGDTLRFSNIDMEGEANHDPDMEWLSNALRNEGWVGQDLWCYDRASVYYQHTLSLIHI